MKKRPLPIFWPHSPAPYKTLLLSILSVYFGLVGRVDGVSDPAKPWVFWYWMEAAVTRAGIAADLEAMAEAGLGGAYLMPIKGKAEPPHISEPVEQLSPRFWEMVHFAMEEADRRGLSIAMHACDGFAVAGGPWVTPDQSMQELVWSRIEVEGGNPLTVHLPQPLTRENHYQDIAVYAIPQLAGAGRNSHSLQASARGSDDDASLARLLNPENTERYRADEPGWIEIEFPEAIDCRSVRIQPEGNNFQAMRLQLWASTDGEQFEKVMQLTPPRHGWQDSGSLTWSVPETRARFFRLVYDPEGSEPGAEDLDFAKWRPVLKLLHIELSEEPKVSQFEGKSGRVWRIAKATTADELPDAYCIPVDAIKDLTKTMNPDGTLQVNLPAGPWTLLRMGHTSTGKTNYIGGNGKGLEIDKFSEAAARLQFRHWFGEAIEQAGEDLAGRVLKVFHVDSWECGSQNWSPHFREDFTKRRGYDPLPFLPLVAGIPIENASTSEQFLHDLRLTISELMNERFFGTLHELASEAGCLFSAESVAPTMVADSLRHFGTVDLPMGEFWLRSPTHDKPNDIHDAISGGHIYGKRIIQAEAFTQLRMAWDEHPGMLKALGDWHFALGINRFVFHVFTHNPWIDREPGMTLSGVGLYFQRNQIWWPGVGAWMEYLQRCQRWLQKGVPVTDVAVFTGEDVPSRSLLPESLTHSLPGLMDPKTITAEEERLLNAGQPFRELPMGVRASANIRDAMNWVDPLNGYRYDSINRDALLRLAEAKDGRLELPGGASYGVLVIPGSRRGAPNAAQLSLEVMEKLISLMDAGVNIIFTEKPEARPLINGNAAAQERLERALARLLAMPAKPWQERSLDRIGIAPDLKISGAKGPGIAWAHRREADGRDIYFLSNQSIEEETVQLSFRVLGKVPLILNPIQGDDLHLPEFAAAERTELEMTLEGHGSRIVIFEASDAIEKTTLSRRTDPVERGDIHIKGPWRVEFESWRGGPAVPIESDILFDWSQSANSSLRGYSGKAIYTTRFNWTDKEMASVRICLGELHNLAVVFLNGVNVGTSWVPEQKLDISSALREGENTLRIEVFNTWANRLIADYAAPEDQRYTFTTAPYRLGDAEPLPAGLLGPVFIQYPLSQ
jgi:hypothetical protein